MADLIDDELLDAIAIAGRPTRPSIDFRMEHVAQRVVLGRALVRKWARPPAATAIELRWTGARVAARTAPGAAGA